MNRIFNLNLHYHCGNRCRNCVSHNTREYSSTRLSFDDSCAIFDRYAPDKNDIVILSGGEPSLYEDLAPLLYHVRERSDCRIVAYSNGEGWADREKLEAAVSCLDRITLSCYGSPEEHAWQSGNERSFEALCYSFRQLEEQRKASSRMSIEFKYVSTQHAPCRIEEILKNLERPERMNSIVLSRMLGEQGKQLPESLWIDTAVENIKTLRSSRWSHIPLKLVDIQPCLLGRELFEEILQAHPKRLDKEIFFFDGKHNGGKKLHFHTRARFFQKCQSCPLANVCGTTATCYGALLWENGKGWSYADE